MLDLKSNFASLQKQCRLIREGQNRILTLGFLTHTIVIITDDWKVTQLKWDSLEERLQFTDGQVEMISSLWPDLTDWETFAQMKRDVLNGTVHLATSRSGHSDYLNFFSTNHSFTFDLWDKSISWLRGDKVEGVALSSHRANHLYSVSKERDTIIVNNYYIYYHNRTIEHRWSRPLCPDPRDNCNTIPTEIGFTVDHQLYTFDRKWMYRFDLFDSGVQIKLTHFLNCDVKSAGNFRKEEGESTATGTPVISKMTGIYIVVGVVIFLIILVIISYFCCASKHAKEEENYLKKMKNKKSKGKGGGGKQVS